MCRVAVLVRTLLSAEASSSCGRSATPVSLPVLSYLTTKVSDPISADQVNLIYSDLLQVLETAPPALQISVRIHVTATATLSLSPSDSMSPMSPASLTSPIPPAAVFGEKKVGIYDKLSAFSKTTWYTGRPNVETVLEEAIASARGSVAVNGMCLHRSPIEPSTDN